MVPLFTPAQVRALDARAIAGGTPSLVLMERAAGHLARAVVELAGYGYGLRVALVCGKGNNGGDGLAAARRLLDAGAAPRVALVGAEPDELDGDPAEQLRRWRQRGGRIAACLDDALAGADVVVDCLLGTGARGAPRPPYDDAVRALEAIAGAGVPVVACDVPSGCDAATGEVPAEAVRAEVTVSLGAHKRGLWMWPARGRCGRLDVADIGILPAEATRAAPAPAPHDEDEGDRPAGALVEAGDVRALLPPAEPDDDKRTRGIVVALAGSVGMSGAATLVARAALAAGAGLVTAATLGGGREAVAGAVPEALTLDVPTGDADAAHERIRAVLDGADAVAVGPGLGLDEATIALVRRVVAETAVPLVLDADGLNAFRHDGDALADHASPLLVLTPHVRELARLAGPQAPEDLWSARLQHVPRLAARWNATIVAKGPGSLTAGPGGRVWVNPTGSAALATGGTGDVLTGLLAALIAQRPASETVAAGVWVHGRAGDVAASTRPPRSVVAGDVAAAVPAALATAGVR